MATETENTAPRAHGGNVIELAAALGLEALDFLDFSSNANSLVDDLTEAVVRETPHFHSVYPDTHSAALRERLARHEGVPADHIMVGNGSSELIFLAFTALKPRSVLLVAPIFSEYVLACANMNIYYELLTLSEANGFRITGPDLERLGSSSFDCVVLCTPNNPTGAVYDMEAVLPRLNCNTVLVDNTYKEFLYGDPAYQGHSHSAYARMLRPGGTLHRPEQLHQIFSLHRRPAGLLPGRSRRHRRLATLPRPVDGLPLQRAGRNQAPGAPGGVSSTTGRHPPVPRGAAPGPLGHRGVPAHLRFAGELPHR